MNYYKIAPLRLNLPALIYKSPLALPKNSVVKICVKNKSALGIVLDSAKKPDFECEEALQSEFYLTPNQAVLGKFIASYYCVNEGVAFNIFTLGKSSNSVLGMQFRTCGNFRTSTDLSLVDSPKISTNTKATPQSLPLRFCESQNLGENQAKNTESSDICHSKSFFCHSERSEESKKNSFVILSESEISQKNNRDSSLRKCSAQNDNFGARVAESALDSAKFTTSVEFANKTQQTIEEIAVEVAEFLGDFECKARLESAQCSKSPKSPQDAPKTKLKTRDEFTQNLPQLSQSQQRALDFILSHDKTLLFGDTGSGKTEIYINAIARTIAQGKNVIFLMPEISLTPQMERRLKGVFGDLVCIWHSKITKAKKEQILSSLDSAKKQIKIIAGARSALFLPLSNIGLIIIDEEHDDAYKSNSSPRYNARDLAIFLAHKERVRLILGSATPSVNSYYNFSKENCVFRLRGGYFQGKKSVSFDSEILSPNLLEKIRVALENKAQTIVFVPLRGNFKVLQCESCGNGAKCKHCSINMSLHSKKNALICHYCGYAEPFFEGRTKCKTCNSTAFKALKIGTQEICKQLQSHFTHAKIAIFDRDEVKSDSKMRKILSEFSDGKIDILVGTQMISKGHDYHNVALVAILGIDGILNSSDFRAYERAVGLLTQISGRTARKNDGEVVINTRNRAFFAPFLDDYEEFLRFELKNRENLYPPFRRIALLIAQNRDESKAKEILQNAKKIVESANKNIEIIGLNKAPIERINGLWRYFLLLRASSAKELVCAVSLCKNLPLIIDIDPQQVF